MSLIFSAIVPHPPILIPSIGKENLERLKITSESYRKLEENVYASGIETIIVISSHGHMHANAFIMNLSPEFEINFEEFGDFTSKKKILGDVGLSHKIKEGMETQVPLQLISDPILDYGSAVPLYLLTKNLPRVKVIPIYYSGLDLAAHFSFGQFLKKEILVSKKRIAVIASGDLSHRLTKDAPAGYSPKGKKFDKKIIEFLEENKIEGILEMKRDLISEAAECGLKSIVILLGILEKMNYQPEVLSYEFPFGVGYLTMNFKI